MVNSHSVICICVLGRVLSFFVLCVCRSYLTYSVFDS